MNLIWIADPPTADRPTTTDPLMLVCDRCTGVEVLHRHLEEWLCGPCRDGVAAAERRDRRQNRRHWTGLLRSRR